MERKVPQKGPEVGPFIAGMLKERPIAFEAIREVCLAKDRQVATKGMPEAWSDGYRAALHELVALIDYGRR